MTVANIRLARSSASSCAVRSMSRAEIAAIYNYHQSLAVLRMVKELTPEIVTKITIYDIQGAPRDVTFTFTKDSENTWSIDATMPNVATPARA